MNHKAPVTCELFSGYCLLMGATGAMSEIKWNISVLKRNESLSGFFGRVDIRFMDSCCQIRQTCLKFILQP